MDETPSAVTAEPTHLARLQALDDLLPTLAGVLDIREVFERVSVIGGKVIPHDLLSLLLFTEDKKNLVVYALAGNTKRFPEKAPLPDYLQWAVTSPWEHFICPDVQNHPLRETPPARAGYRTVLSVPIRLQAEVVGTIDFWALRPNIYAAADILVARRIADHVALALSHQRLAEEARRTEELRTREARLELLEERLSTATDGQELTSVFDHVSAVARKVLPHDALVLPVLLPDGKHARAYAYSGLGARAPTEVVRVPEAILRGERDYELLDDLSTSQEAHDRGGAELGFRSALRVTIRLDGKLAAGLTFLSRTPAAFKAPDILVARRIADKVALALSRIRHTEASKRADDASARASALEARVNSLAAELNTVTGYRRVVGQSQSWMSVLKQATQVAATDTTVLLLGESGTGKEVIARFIHRASPRSKAAFVALNCAALPEPLLESELFGFEKGAFTGATQTKPGQIEQAAGGVLFLDEVAEMTAPAQAKFLRVLQEREFQRLGSTRTLKADVRVVAATNRNLTAAMEARAFREDLYYRLHVFEIQLPPLRDRKDDILPLSEAFLHDIAKSFGRPPAGMSREAREDLLSYEWPGNVRELRNTLERAAILCEGGLIAREHLALPPASAAPAPIRAPEHPRGGPQPSEEVTTTDLRVLERVTIERALRDARYNKSRAAKQLGLTRKQLYVRLRQHGLD